MIYYIVTLGSTALFFYNIQTVFVWFFYFCSYIEIFFKKQKIKNKESPVYLGMLKKFTNEMYTKELDLYDFDKKDDYLFYKCLNYETSDKKTNYKFINVTVQDKDKKINLELSTNDYTFYLINNAVLDKRFIQWYCFKHHNGIKISSVYKLHIIDHKANMITLNESQYLLLDNESYTIKNI